MLGEWSCLCGISGVGYEQVGAHIREHREIETALRKGGYDLYWRRAFTMNLNFTVRLVKADAD